MALSDFFKRVLVVTIGVVTAVMVITAVMTFVGLPPTAYNPYMYFIIAIGVLALFLSPTPVSVADAPS